MVVIEVFTPVVQRILKHNMVSSPDHPPPAPDCKASLFFPFSPKIWGRGLAVLA